MNIYQLTVWFQADSDESRTVLFSSIQAAKDYVKEVWEAPAEYEIYYEIYEPTGSTNSDGSLEMRSLVSGPS
jgi:hypothetical protein